MILAIKSEITIPKEMRRNFSRIAGLLEIADKEFNQIREGLAEYKANAQTQIKDDGFLNRELDAVILQIMLNSNESVLSINNHIADLVRRPLIEVEGDEEFKDTIFRLNWLGIETVQQLNDALSKHSMLAKKKASEKLKDYYKKESSSRIKETIAFFYLCYAILLAQNSSKEIIYRYLQETHIGLIHERDEDANELLDLKYLVC